MPVYSVELAAKIKFFSPLCRVIQPLPSPSKLLRKGEECSDFLLAWPTVTSLGQATTQYLKVTVLRSDLQLPYCTISPRDDAITSGIAPYSTVMVQLIDLDDHL